MDRLAQAALVGTRRQLPRLEHPAVPPDRSPEETLLAASAAFSLSALAGRKPPAWQGKSQPCDPEALPPAGTRLLRRLAEGEHAAVWPEWLEAARRAGRRCPERYLPELLELGRYHRDLRPGIAAVAGKRGLWLAGRNPDWRYLLADSEENEIWETGPRTVRQDWLERLRRRAPAEARQKLAEVWEKEHAEARQGFLTALATGVGPEDEPFLERALQDKSRGVREEAAELLSRFDSRFRRELPPVLEVTRGWISSSLEVHPPAACPDYLDPKPPKGMGEKAWWLQQLVALSPLPDVSTLKLAARSEWKDALLAGWETATELQRRADWAEALRTPDVFSVLPPERREAILLERMTLPLLLAHRHPFGLKLSKLFVTRLRERVGRDPADFDLARALTELALWLDPAVAGEVGSLETTAAMRDPVDRLANVLTFRLGIREEFPP